MDEIANVPMRHESSSVPTGLAIIIHHLPATEGAAIGMPSLVGRLKNCSSDNRKNQSIKQMAIYAPGFGISYKK